VRPWRTIIKRGWGEDAGRASSCNYTLVFALQQRKILYNLTQRIRTMLGTVPSVKLTASYGQPRLDCWLSVIFG